MTQPDRTEQLTINHETSVAALGSRSPALPGPLRTSLGTTLHLLDGEVAHVTTRGGVAALGETLLATETEPLVLLLALHGGTVVAVAATLAAGLGGSVLDGDIEQVILVLGGSGGIRLALYNN